MQFSTLFSAAALVNSALAIIQFTNFPMPTAIVTGQVYTITWTGATTGQPVTLRLRQGDPGNLSVVGTITTAASGGSYAWTPDTMIASGTNYALEIDQGTDVNYSMQFSIVGTAAASGSVSASGTATATSALSSSLSASVSSARSSISSALSSIASASSRNATMTSTSMSTSTSSHSATTTATSTSAPTSGSGRNLQSPVALILGAFVAMMYFN